MNLSNLEPALLHPAPEVMRGVQCEFCNKPQASFWYGDDGEESKIFICSICTLYGSDWGKHFNQKISETAFNIEKSKSTSFRRDSNGRLLLAGDADHVLGLIVLTGRVAMVSRSGASI